MKAIEIMTLREKQSIFALNISKLHIFAFDNGYETTKGEALRTHDQQMLYFEGYTLIKAGSNLKLAHTSRKSKTMNSYHLKKLAEDINLFKDGEYKSDAESFKPLSDYWKSLNDENISGYDWGWDFNHFQMGK